MTDATRPAFDGDSLEEGPTWAEITTYDPMDPDHAFALWLVANTAARATYAEHVASGTVIEAHHAPSDLGAAEDFTALRPLAQAFAKEFLTPENVAKLTTAGLESGADGALVVWWELSYHYARTGR